MNQKPPESQEYDDKNWYKCKGCEDFYVSSDLVFCQTDKNTFGWYCHSTTEEFRGCARGDSFNKTLFQELRRRCNASLGKRHGQDKGLSGDGYNV